MKSLLLAVTISTVFLHSQTVHTFSFVQLADPQFGMYPVQKDFAKERKNLTTALEGINALNPTFVVICGDLVNNKDSIRQLEAFRETMAKLDRTIPLHLVPGNHDVGNTPTSSSLAQYRERFGPDYYSFVQDGWTCIVLNTSLIKDPSHAGKEEEAQREWLTATLDSASRKHARIVVFQHHPWFVRYPNEPSSYFNIPRKTRLKYLALLESHGVQYVFAGHLHQNAHGHYRALAMITSGPVGMPLGTSPSGLRVVIVGPHEMKHTYYSLKKIPRTVGVPGS